nr:hypothetical protein [Pandoravirus aubagnensis]
MYGRRSFAQQDPRCASPDRLPSPLGFYLSSVVSALEQDLDRHHDTIFDGTADCSGVVGATTLPPPSSWIDTGPASWFALAWPDPPAPGLVLPYARRQPFVDEPYHAAPASPPSSRPMRHPTWSERVVVEMSAQHEAPAIQTPRVAEHHDTPKAVVCECLIDYGVVPPPGLPPPLEPHERVASTRAPPKRTDMRARRNSAQ